MSHDPGTNPVDTAIPLGSDLAQLARGPDTRVSPELLADIPRRTQPFSYLGLPALALPCGFADGLPVGMQLVGRPHDEATLLAVGAAFQSMRDWHLRCPPSPVADPVVRMPGGTTSNERSATAP